MTKADPIFTFSLSTLRGFMPASACRPNSSSRKQQDASTEIEANFVR